MASTEVIAHKISNEREKTLKFFMELPESLWHQQLYSDGEQWSVHEVLAHIVEAEGSYYQLFVDICNGGSGASNEFDIDRHNATEVIKISAKSRDELLSMFDERRGKILALVQGLAPDMLNNVGNHPYLGTSTLEEMLRLYLLHTNLHLRDIRKIIQTGGMND